MTLLVYIVEACLELKKHLKDFVQLLLRFVDTLLCVRVMPSMRGQTHHSVMATSLLYTISLLLFCHL